MGWSAFDYDDYIEVTPKNMEFDISLSGTRSEFDSYGVMKHVKGLRLKGFGVFEEDEIRFDQNPEILGFDNSHDQGIVWVIDDNKSRLTLSVDVTIKSKKYNWTIDFFHDVSIEYLENAISVWIQPFNLNVVDGEVLLDIYFFTNANPNIESENVEHEEFRQQMRDRFINEDDVSALNRYQEKPSTVIVRVNQDDYDHVNKSYSKSLKQFLSLYKDYSQEQQELLAQIEQNEGIRIIMIGLNHDDQTMKYYAGLDMMNLASRINQMNGPYSVTEYLESFGSTETQPENHEESNEVDSDIFVDPSQINEDKLYECIVYLFSKRNQIGEEGENSLISITFDNDDYVITLSKFIDSLSRFITIMDNLNNIILVTKRLKTIFDESGDSLIIWDALKTFNINKSQLKSVYDS